MVKSLSWWQHEAAADVCCAMVGIGVYSSNTSILALHCPGRTVQRMGYCYSILVLILIIMTVLEHRSEQNV